jgi:hypothetical protein
MIGGLLQSWANSGSGNRAYSTNSRILDHGRVDWLDGQCLPDGRTAPHDPIFEALRLNFHVGEGENPLQTREKLARMFWKSTRALARQSPSRSCSLVYRVLDEMLHPMQHPSPREIGSEHAPFYS